MTYESMNLRCPFNESEVCVGKHCACAVVEEDRYLEIGRWYCGLVGDKRTTVKNTIAIDHFEVDAL